MADTTKLACNRIPFKTDSSCDRGDVDIHGFDSFPICHLIDPTPPDTAFPQIDFPVIPFTPPPCACINIEVSGSGELEDRSDIFFEVDFRSIGDCCEGNYEADIDLKIPCMPFSVEGGSSSHDVEIEQFCDNGSESPSGKLNLGVGTDSCTLSFNPTLKLRLPKPKELEFDTDFNIENIPCAESPEGSFWFEINESGECTREVIAHLNIGLPHIANLTTCSDEGPIEIEMTGELGGSGELDLNAEKDSCGFTTSLCPTLTLNLPCPVNDDLKVKATIGWGNSGESASAVIARREESSCELTAESNVLDLQLPCPLPDEIKVKAKIDWGDKGKSDSAVIAEKEESSCALTATSNVLDLQLPCPLPDEIKVKAKIGWGDKGSSVSAVIAEKDDSGCEITTTSNFLDLQLPCPLPDELKVKAKIGWGDSGKSDSAVIAKKDDSGCEFGDFSDNTLDLKLPCPLPKEIKVRAKIGWGDSGDSASVTIAQKESSACELTDTSNIIDLKLPCPFDNLELEGDEPSEDRPYIEVKKVEPEEGEEKEEGECSGKWSIHLVMPGGWGESSVSSSSPSSSSPSSSSPSSSSPSSSSPSSSSPSSSSPSSSSPGSSSPPGSSPASSGSGGSSTGTSSPSPKTATFQAVTGVECSEGGGISVTTSTFTIDFDNGTVSASVDGDDDTPKGRSLKAGMARDLLAAAVKAISNDPSILAIVDKPGSREADMAMNKLGLYNGIADDFTDDSALDDIL